MPKNASRLGVPRLVSGLHFDCVCDSVAENEELMMFMYFVFERVGVTANFTLDGQQRFHHLMSDCLKF
jgi:hypothetical protein